MAINRMHGGQKCETLDSCMHECSYSGERAGGCPQVGRGGVLGRHYMVKMREFVEGVLARRSPLRVSARAKVFH